MFLGAQTLKNQPVMWETRVQSLGWEDPLEKGKATHSSILVQPLWRTVWRLLKKLGINPACDPTVPLLGMHHDKTTAAKTRAAPCSQQHHSLQQDTGATWVSIGRWADQEHAPHIWGGVLLSHQKALESVLGRWVNLEPVYTE